MRASAPNAHRGGQLLTDLALRLEQIPDVESAAAVSGGLPLSGTTFVEDIAVPGLTGPDDDGVSLRAVTPGYHRTMRIPLRGGRYLTDADAKGSAGVMLINEAAAKKYFPGESPLGRTVLVQGERQIVGIVGDIRQEGPESAMLPEVYIPIAQLAVPMERLLARRIAPRRFNMILLSLFGALALVAAAAYRVTRIAVKTLRSPAGPDSTTSMA